MWPSKSRNNQLTELGVLTCGSHSEVLSKVAADARRCLKVEGEVRIVAAMTNPLPQTKKELDKKGIDIVAMPSVRRDLGDPRTLPDESPQALRSASLSGAQLMNGVDNLWMEEFPGATGSVLSRSILIAKRVSGVRPNRAAVLVQSPEGTEWPRWSLLYSILSWAKRYKTRPLGCDLAVIVSPMRFKRHGGRAEVDRAICGSLLAPCASVHQGGGQAGPNDLFEHLTQQSTWVVPTLATAPSETIRRLRLEDALSPAIRAVISNPESALAIIERFPPVPASPLVVVSVPVSACQGQRPADVGERLRDVHQVPIHVYTTEGEEQATAVGFWPVPEDWAFAALERGGPGKTNNRDFFTEAMQKLAKLWDVQPEEVVHPLRV